MASNSFDERVAKIQAAVESEKLKVDTIKLAWEIVKSERRDTACSVDSALSDLRKAYKHINETFTGSEGS